MSNEVPEKTKANLSVIDAAIARAKAQAAEKANGTTEKPVKEKKEKAPKAPKEKKEKKEKEPKAPKEPKPVKEPKGAPAHLKKVEAAAAALPHLDEVTAGLLAAVKAANLPAPQLTALATHLAHAARVIMTSAAITSVKPEAGATVKIVSGDRGAAKYVGMTGVLAEVRNIRCFVNVTDADGKVIKKNLYLYVSDVEVTAPAEKPAASEEPKAAEPSTETSTEQASAEEPAPVSGVQPIAAASEEPSTEQASAEEPEATGTEA